MNKKGFILIEVLMGLTLLAIVTITCLPIMTTAFNNLMLAKEKTKMVFVAESIIEEIKSFDYNSTQEGEYLFDIKLIDLIDKLENEDSIIVKLPLDIENSNFKYRCTIYKEDNFENLWKVQVEISLPNERRKVKNVSIVAYIPKPRPATNLKED